MNPLPGSRQEYLERLGDLLPARERPRVLKEVESLLLDRAEAEAAAGEDEAERRALAALGPPEVLAEQLVTDPLTIDLATRRAFARWLALVFAGHLLLSILLAAAGAGGAAVPGLLGPLPLEPFAATFTGVLSIFLIDTGALLAGFMVLGRRRIEARLPRLSLRPVWTRRDAVLALVLLALVGLLLHPFRDIVFAVRTAERLEPFLAPDLTALLPLVDGVLLLFAVRHAMTLLGRGDRAESVALDALGCLAAVGALVLAATRGEIVRLPQGALQPATHQVLGDLLTRTFLMVFVVSALLLTLRFVKRLLRLRDLGSV